MRLAIVFLLMLPAISVAQVTEHSVIVSLSGGYAWFSPDDFNTFLTHLNTFMGSTSAYPYPEIKGGVNLRADIGYYLLPQVSVHVGVGYMRGSSESQQGVTTSSGPEVVAWAEETYSATSIPIDLGGLYHFKTNSQFGIAGGAFIEAHLATAKYNLEETAYSQGYEASLSKTGFGVRICIAPEYALTQTLAVKADLGYRLAKINDKDGGEGFFPDQLDLDLSGPYVMAGVTLAF